MAIQPKNTNAILVDSITEKTPLAGIAIGDASVPAKILLIQAGSGAKTKIPNGIEIDVINENTGAAGVSLNTTAKVTAAAVIPMSANKNLGTSTSSEHWLIAYIKSVLSAADQVVGTSNTSTLSLVTNAVTRFLFTATGSLKKRLGHTGYTGGGEIEHFTAATDSTSTSPVVIFTYPIAAVQTQVMIRVDLMSRDNTTGNQSYLESACSASRAAGAAVAGSVTTLHTVGVALHTITLNATSNDIQVRIQNVSGTNTTSAVADIRVIPVSTAT